MNQNSLESLALPQDLYWNGKMEPTSPPSSELFPISESDEYWLIQDENFADDILSIENKDVDLKIKTTKEEFDADYKNFIEIIEQDVKEEPWSAVKSSLSQPLIDFEPFDSGFHQQSMVTKVQNPYEGDNCKSIYNHAIILTQLTPPQSPPQPAALTPPQSPPQESQDFKEVDHQNPHHGIQVAHISPVYQNITNPIPASVPTTIDGALSSSASSQITYTTAAYNNAAVNQSSDIAQNCQIIDEIVETRAKELPDWHDKQNEFNTYLMASLSPMPQSVDEDWGRSSPSNLSSSQSSASSVIGDSSSSDGGGKMQTSSSLAKKRTRPYGRGLEDRKNRKKEQNKNAATRYRQKKKHEMETVLSEEQELSNRNQSLKATLTERKREAKYLKKLILEFCQNKKF